MWIKENDYILFKSIDFGYLELSENKSLKFALFDLDGTLITTKNGRNPKTPQIDKDPKNYIYLFDKDKYFKIFQMLKDCGFIVGIITNQSRIHYKGSTILQKIENILNDFQSILGWKPYVVININRNMLKPSPKSFELLKTKVSENGINNEVQKDEVNNEVIYTVLDTNLVVPNIFYVGDACGIDDEFVPYRFSNVDKDFVFNVNQNLSKNDLHMEFIRAKDFFGSSDINISTERELVILMGNPASGKSRTAYKFQSASYKIIISDEIKDKKKMIKFVDFYMNQNKSVVVDAMNYNTESRAIYIQIAKKYDYKVRILWHIRDGRCWNNLRGLYEKEFYGNSVYIHPKPISDIVYNVYSSKFEPPIEYEIFSGSPASKGTIELIY